MVGPCALNILIVHGIGGGHRTRAYARPLQDSIRREFDRVMRGLKLRDASSHDAQAKRALRFEAACWDPVTQVPQDSLLRVMFGRPGLFSRFNLTTLARRNMVGLLGDVTAYERDPDNKVYRAIHGVVDQCMSALSTASAGEGDDEGYAPLTIVGHSLGSVIASDHVWDHTRSTGHSHRLGEHHLALVNMFTLGSPMALYALRNNAYGGRESIRESLDAPIKTDPDGGLWLNLFDRQDAIAFPLEPIDSYNAAGVIDHTVDVGSWLTRWNLGSHVGYWRSDEVARLIGHKLALDWARLNSPRFAEKGYAKALAEYHRGLRR